MKHSTSNRRSRGRSNNGGSTTRRSPNGRSQVIDSNGPDVRIRGTAQQILDKYLTLARDAASADDRIMQENFLQHAEHYQRIINSWEESRPEETKSNSSRPQPQQQQPKQQSQPQQQQPKQQPQRSQSRTRRQPDNSQEDLGLPDTMLIPAPKSNSEPVQKQEIEMEQA